MISRATVHRIGAGLNAAIDAAVQAVEGAVRDAMPIAAPVVATAEAIDLGARLPPYPLDLVAIGYLKRSGFVEAQVARSALDHMTLVEAVHECGALHLVAIDDLVRELPTVEATDWMLSVLGQMGCYCVRRAP